MPGFDHFSWIAPWYERFSRFSRREQFITLANLPVAGRLLDLGGGTGRIAYGLVGEVEQAVVADVSPGMLRQAGLKEGLRPVQAAGEQLPFPEDIFERVIMVDAFHHVADQRQVAREMWRVLKPDGRIVILEPDIRTTSVKLIAIAEKVLLMRSHFIDPQAIAALFIEFGATVHIEVEQGTAWVMIDKTNHVDRS
jgi:ubiquinone/menaquinone biosynthesis C-methylase UbiE